MTWRDAAALAARGLVRRIGRAILTVLAVALATALLVGLLTIADTARTRILSQLSKGGPLASIRVTDSSSSPLDQEDVRRIQGLVDVQSVVPVMAVRQLVVPSNPPVYQASSTSIPGSTPAVPRLSRSFVDTVVGADVSQADRLPITLLAGRLPASDSLTEVAVTKGYLQRVGLDARDPVPVLGSEVVLGSPRRFLVGGDDQVRGRWTRAVVVGVVAQDAENGDLLAPIAYTRQAAAFADGAVALGAPARDGAEYSTILVVADGLDAIAPVRSRLEALGLSTSAPENLIASVQRYLHVVEIVLAGIGLIALIIAAIGIANAMLAAVRERRREIGVLKAIGARDRDVLRVFLLEASVIGVTGGIVGVAAGWMLARSVAVVVNGYLTGQGLTGVSVGAPVLILLGGLGGAILLSILAGTYPAVRAARLPAREAVSVG